MESPPELTKLVVLIDTYRIANWPVVHSEVAEAHDNIVETHHLVPLPVYDSNGMLIPPSHYKDAIAGALLHVNFTLTHWFIPASGAGEAVNTFVADLKSARILLDAPPRRSPPKRRTAKVEPRIMSPSRRSERPQEV
jgi:hypothetical protein